MTNKQNISDSLFLLLNSTKLSYVWISSQKPCMCENQWDGPRVCKCLTWRVFTKFTNAPFPDKDWQGAQMAGSLCVCVGGRVHKYSWNWLIHYVESCKLWSLPSLGVYYLSCIHDVKYNNSLTKMKEWWNKVLTDSWSNVQFFLLFTSIHKTNWKVNIAIYQKSLGESLRRSEDVKKLAHKRGCSVPEG